jgi:hypothetical protein
MIARLFVLAPTLSLPRKRGRGRWSRSLAVRGAKVVRVSGAATPRL